MLIHTKNKASKFINSHTTPSSHRKRILPLSPPLHKHRSPTNRNLQIPKNLAFGKRNPNHRIPPSRNTVLSHPLERLISRIVDGVREGFGFVLAVGGFEEGFCVFAGEDGDAVDGADDFFYGVPGDGGCGCGEDGGDFAVGFDGGIGVRWHVGGS